MGCPPPCIASKLMLAREVGISRFALGTACGQSRRLLRTSSGAKSRVENHPPASRPITLSPALTSGNTATPPTAPSPITTTSVLGSSVAMVTSLGNGGRIYRILGIGRHVIGRLPAGRQASALADFFRRRDDAHTGIANKIPADEVAIATVVGIAEGAVDGVIADHIEEAGTEHGEGSKLVFSHRLDDGVLLGRREQVEEPVVPLHRIVIQCLQPDRVLVPGACIGAGQGSVDIVYRSGLMSAGSAVITGQDAGSQSVQRGTFCSSESLESLHYTDALCRCGHGLRRYGATRTGHQRGAGQSHPLQQAAAGKRKRFVLPGLVCAGLLLVAHGHCSWQAAVGRCHVLGSCCHCACTLTSNRAKRKYPIRESSQVYRNSGQLAGHPYSSLRSCGPVPETSTVTSWS